jgi:hypothetical protein
VEPYVSIDGITIRRARNYGIATWDTSHVTITNSLFEWCWIASVSLGGNSPYSDFLFDGCTFRYNGCTGIDSNPQVSASGITIRRCSSYENGKYQWNATPWDTTHQYTSGMKLWNPHTDCLFEFNKVYSNGPATATDINQGSGIWLDYVVASSGHENIVRYNLVYDNRSCGLNCEVSQYAHWYCNVLYDNSQTGAVGVWSTAQMRVDARNGSDGAYNRFYNNTCYGGLYGIICLTTSQEAGTEVKYNEFKNNIVVSTTNAKLYADTGGDNDGVTGTGNVYNANCFGAQGAGFINWNATAYATYDTWLAASSQTDNNVEADPSFQSVGSDQYWLAVGSPCIDKGVNLGSPYNTALYSTSTWPSGVVTSDQNSFGSGWEIGAYVYPVTDTATSHPATRALYMKKLYKR